jgi:hypothetical protein
MALMEHVNETHPGRPCRFERPRAQFECPLCEWESAAKTSWTKHFMKCEPKYDMRTNLSMRGEDAPAKIMGFASEQRKPKPLLCCHHFANRVDLASSSTGARTGSTNSHGKIFSTLDQRDCYIYIEKKLHINIGKN